MGTVLPSEAPQVTHSHNTGSLMMFSSAMTEYSTCTGELDSPHARAEAGAEEAANLALGTALLEKHLKSRLAVAADHFNRSPVKGLEYFRVHPCYRHQTCSLPRPYLVSHSSVKQKHYCEARHSMLRALEALRSMS